MPNDLQNNQNLVPAKIAARESNYSTDYIALLAREGKITAEKIGRQWHVNLDEVLRFAFQAEREQMNRQAQLKAERKIEYSSYTRNFEYEVALKMEQGKQPAFLMAMLVFFFALSTSAIGFYSANQDQLASLPTIDVSPLEDAAVALFKFITPRSWYAHTESELQGVAAAEEVQRSRSYQLVGTPSIAEKETIIRDAFSDDLEIVFSAEVNDSGVITPLFKENPDNKYRFHIEVEEVLGGIR